MRHSDNNKTKKKQTHIRSAIHMASNFHIKKKKSRIHWYLYANKCEDKSKQMERNKT